jgi:hypothetical protein
MRNLVVFVASLLLGWTLSVSAYPAEFGSKEEAQALVAKAIAYTKEAGPDKAFAEFSDPKGKWADRDLYIFVIDHTGTRLAHGQNPKLVGKSMFEMVDVNGKAYGKEIWDTASKGPGWVDYWFIDPITKKQMPKTVYVEKSGDYVFGCGVYKR